MRNQFLQYNIILCQIIKIEKHFGYLLIYFQILSHSIKHIDFDVLEYLSGFKLNQ